MCHQFKNHLRVQEEKVRRRVKEEQKMKRSQEKQQKNFRWEFRCGAAGSSSKRSSPPTTNAKDKVLAKIVSVVPPSIDAGAARERHADAPRCADSATTSSSSLAPQTKKQKIETDDDGPPLARATTNADQISTCFPKCRRDLDAVIDIQ